MIKEHDKWSKLGEENLGEHNIAWVERIEGMPSGPSGSGPMTLMKAILNDHWADRIPDDYPMTPEEYDYVMSKLYWCWVAWLECTHLEVGEEV